MRTSACALILPLVVATVTAQLYPVGSSYLGYLARTQQQLQRDSVPAADTPQRVRRLPQQPSPTSSSASSTPQYPIPLTADTSRVHDLVAQAYRKTPGQVPAATGYAPVRTAFPTVQQIPQNSRAFTVDEAKPYTPSRVFRSHEGRSSNYVPANDFSGQEPSASQYIPAHAFRGQSASASQYVPAKSFREPEGQASNHAPKESYEAAATGYDSPSIGHGGHHGGGRVEFQMHGQHGPHSYKFGYDTGKGYNRQFRYEERDGYGHVKGSYGFYDKHGKLQLVKYTAHPEKGYHAETGHGNY